MIDDWAADVEARARELSEMVRDQQHDEGADDDA